MSALMKRLERGIDALEQGDRDTAESILDEVSSEPGSREPISGLLDETEERFYELRARLSGDVGDNHEDDWDEDEQWDDADWDDAIDVSWDDPEEREVDDEGSWDADIVLTTRDSEADKRLSLSLEYVGEDAWVEVERHEESFRELEIGAQETRDTVVTVQSYNSSLTLQPDAELPAVVAQNIIHDVDGDRQWTECHVEELRVLRTTLVYKDEPTRLALPCACEV